MYQVHKLITLLRTTPICLGTQVTHNEILTNTIFDWYTTFTFSYRMCTDRITQS